MRKIFSIILIVGFLGIAPAPPTQAATAASLPPSLKFTTVASGLVRPLFVTHAGDGSGRLFIVQQGGKILIMKNGTLNTVPFLDVSGLITTTGNEQGLLGLAFHPSYSTNGRFFITYTQSADGAVILAEYQVSADPDIADTSTARIVLTIPEPYVNHNGGMIAFGPDGYLYQSVGDGGSGGDPQGNGQNLNTLLGKILRMDVDGVTPYAIPADNPFVGNVNVKEEIWAYGLRNPWRFSFDRAAGNLYIGDVGQNEQEEIDFQPAASAGGENYGWSVLEGDLCYKPATGCTPPPSYAPPVAVYDHGVNDSIGCSVTGGYVYRGSQSPTLAGVYFYGDYCQGVIWGLIKDASNKWVFKQIVDTNYRISSFGEDEQGELYLTDLAGGLVVKISEVTILRKTFRSIGKYDGFILETGETTSRGGYKNSGATVIYLGDNAANRQYRSILHFHTASLPDNAVVTSGTLSLKRRNIVGTNPFTDLRYILIDIRSGSFSGNPELQSFDFQAKADQNWAGKFRNTPVGKWYTAQLLDRGLSYINLTGPTQLRLRFRIDDNNNLASNIIKYFNGDAENYFDRPRLTVEYFVP